MAQLLRIGTRGSALALAQAAHINTLIDERCPGMDVEIEVVRVSGDLEVGSGSTKPAAPQPGAVSDKRRWIDAIEDALQSKTIDLAVHSAKDVPGELAQGLALLGAPRRAPAQDVLCGAPSLDSLRPGARVGTSSLRRAAQLRANRPDLEILQIRGNVDTRLRKLGERPEWDGIVIALAGMQRLGREREVGAVLDLERFVPAPGQGTLALEGRLDDERTGAIVAAIADPESFACLLAERSLARELQADCHTPLGAYAAPAAGERLRMQAWVGLPDGSQWASDELLGDRAETEALGRSMAQRLGAVGARELLGKARAMSLASLGDEPR